MSDRARLVMLVLAALILAPAAFKLAVAMPQFGAHPLLYGDAINALAPTQRLVTNAVTAVNFDYRGFDTLGEEFMLLAAVTGAVVLLRGNARRGSLSAAAGRIGPGRPILPRSARTRPSSSAGFLAPLIMLVFGIYVALHAIDDAWRWLPGWSDCRNRASLLDLSRRWPIRGWRRHRCAPRLLAMSARAWGPRSCSRLMRLCAPDDGDACRSLHQHPAVRHPDPRRVFWRDRCSVPKHLASPSPCHRLACSMLIPRIHGRDASLSSPGDKEPDERREGHHS